MGNCMGNSTCHYLIVLINFILHQQESHFSKAFNRQDHSILITKLSDMGFPGWLLRLDAAFLKDRSMKVKYKGKFSKLFPLPGGGPQGSLLGLFLFLILINYIGYEGQLNNAGELITCMKKMK